MRINQFNKVSDLQQSWRSLTDNIDKQTGDIRRKSYGNMRNLARRLKTIGEKSGREVANELLTQIESGNTTINFSLNKDQLAELVQLRGKASHSSTNHISPEELARASHEQMYGQTLPFLWE